MSDQMRKDVETVAARYKDKADGDAFRSTFALLCGDHGPKLPDAFGRKWSVLAYETRAEAEKKMRWLELNVPNVVSMIKREGDGFTVSWKG